MQPHDDPRLPPLIYAPTKARTPRKRRAEPAGASNDLRAIETEVSQLRDQCARQAVLIGRQEGYIAFLENQIKITEEIARSAADMLEVP